MDVTRRSSMWHRLDDRKGGSDGGGDILRW